MVSNRKVSRYFSHVNIGNFCADKWLFLLFFLCPIFLACSGKMSVEEARKVTVDLREEAFVPPPRHIDDILAALTASGKFNPSMSADYIILASRSAPSTDNQATLVSFYLKRGWASYHILRWDQALQDLRKAQEYADKAGITNNELLNRLAGMEMYAGNYKRALEILEKTDDKSCATYWLLVAGYAKAGDFKRAQTYKNYGIGHCGQSVFDKKVISKMKAHTLEAQGRYKQAENQWKINIRLSDSLRSEYPRWYVSSRSLLADNLRRQNRLLEAEIEIRDALKASIELGGTETATSGHLIGIMGEIIQRQGRLEDAEKLIRVGIQILENSGISMDSYALIVNRMALGNILADQERYLEAMQQYDLAKSALQKSPYFFEKLFGRNPNLILSLLQTERNREALELISAVYTLYLENYSKENYLTAEILGLRGMTHFKMENFSQAAQDFFSAVSVLLASNSAREGEYSSNQRLRIILESYIDLLHKIHTEGLETKLNIDASAEAFRLSDAIRGHTVQRALGASGARMAVVDPELADLVRKEQDASHQVKALKVILSDNLSAPIDQRSPGAINDIQLKLDNLKKARQALLDEIKSRFPKYADFTNSQPATVDLTQKLLRPGEALISTYTTVNHTYIWAIPNKGEIRFAAIKLGKKEITQAVNRLRQSLDSKPLTLGEIPDFDTATAYQLYRQLLKPVESGWQDATDLLIVTHRPLGQIPFSILLTEPTDSYSQKEALFSRYKKAHWLIRRVSLTRLPSVSTLISLRGHPQSDPGRKPFAGFGDPFFNKQQLAEARKEEKQGYQFASQENHIHVRGIRISKEGALDNDEIVSCTLNNLNRLPDTSAEITFIASTLGADPVNDVFLGKRASEHRVKSMDLSNRRVIAFATHALVPGDLDGLDQPALALSSPSVTGDAEDGLLTMGEILRLKLNADWVVLSACNTGAAQGRGAEAISGLGRAFFYAGTRAILVSMWPVETTSAHELTTGLFRYQQEDPALSRARALQKSTLALIDAPGLKDPSSGKIAASYAHPFFWAPFIIVGESAVQTH